MFTIITEKTEWNNVLKSLGQYDFYHTYDYHHISKNIDEAPILIHYTKGDKTIALPLLLRSIMDTPYKDATSVYGYAGPLTQNIDANFDNSQFKVQLHSYFNNNNIISAFSRLHPFILSQRIVLKDIGETSELGNIVNIDLTKDLATQRHEYQKRLKTYINKSRKAYTISEAKTESEILKFIDLYEENMRRVHADQRYFFSREYYFGLIESKDFHVETLLAECNNTQEIVGGAMFIKENNIVQYHLSGVKEEYLQLNPIKLLIDEARITATREKYSFLNLGGGIGGREDSLFQFKTGFSKDFRTFEIWKYIADYGIYNNLVEKVLKNVPKNLHEAYYAYFPHYRCNS